MQARRWVWAGLALAAGCGGGDGTSPAPATDPKPAPKDPPKAADVELVAGTLPEKIVTAPDFLANPKAHTGRLGIEGIVAAIDGKNARFQICDPAEAG